jgi:pyruvate/2-oxoacid:ferredoxin oxidoreductase alpha subunit
VASAPVRHPAIPSFGQHTDGLAVKYSGGDFLSLVARNPAEAFGAPAKS